MHWVMLQGALTAWDVVDASFVINCRLLPATEDLLFVMFAALHRRSAPVDQAYGPADRQELLRYLRALSSEQRNQHREWLNTMKRFLDRVFVVAEHLRVSVGCSIVVAKQDLTARVICAMPPRSTVVGVVSNDSPRTPKKC